MENNKKESNPIGKTDKPNSQVDLPQPETVCYHDGYQYSPGSWKCFGGYNHLCTSSGKWNHFNDKC